MVTRHEEAAVPEEESARACMDLVMWSHKMATSVLGCEE